MGPRLRMPTGPFPAQKWYVMEGLWGWFYLSQTNLRQALAWPVETTTTVDRIRELDFSTAGDPLTNANRSSETSPHRSVQGSTSQGILEENCNLGSRDIFSRLTESHGLMINLEIIQPIAGNSNGGAGESIDVTSQSTCPYHFTLVTLGDNSFPREIMNATCDCEVCDLTTECEPNIEPLPWMTTCKPQFYYVPIIRYQTERIQTELCLIQDFRVESVPIATGCTCVYIDP